MIDASILMVIRSLQMLKQKAVKLGWVVLVVQTMEACSDLNEQSPFWGEMGMREVVDMGVGLEMGMHLHLSLLPIQVLI